MSKSAANSSKRNSVRIIGGELRSRRIEFVDHDGLRPSSDRVRETLFNWLQDNIAGARCLDLFAGSGVLGIEALSRGASSLDLVEVDRKVASTLRDSLQTLGLENARLNVSSAEQWLQQQALSSATTNRPFDIIFLDPPFADKLLPTVCKELNDSRVVGNKTLVYLESDQPVDGHWLPENWQQLKSKKAGQVFFYLYQINRQP